MKLPEVPVRVWTVWFEDLGGRTDSVTHGCMERSERFASQTLMRLGTPNACLGPGNDQGALVGRIAILGPRGDGSGCRLLTVENHVISPRESRQSPIGIILRCDKRNPKVSIRARPSLASVNPYLAKATQKTARELSHS